MMRITKWHDVDQQTCWIDNKGWAVTRLIFLSLDLPIMEIPLDHLCIDTGCYKKIKLREMVMHFTAIKNADLQYPIILDEDGGLMDGRHRIMRALSEGIKTIKAVRFDKNPSPCWTKNTEE
ncbi:MAG: hypothetical protein KAJ10_15970 [Thermodesulfovibrionia bacterium]|nr:hypothetical protein [Thermodesulfovibrionia bacterium]